MNITNHEPSLEEKLRGVIRIKQYSRQTEETYVQWYRRFVRFQAHGQMRHPKDMGVEEVTAFLTNLAVNKGLAASSQNQALNALIFLYKEVLKIELDGINPNSAIGDTPFATIIGPRVFPLLGAVSF